MRTTGPCPEGGWTGAAAGCQGEPEGTGSNRADLLVRIDAADPGLVLDWVNFQDDYAGTPPDSGCGLCADCGGGCDREVRGSGEAALAGALASIRQYVEDDVRAVDPQAACRPYAVFLFTDGLNSCAGDPAAEAAALCAIGIPVYVVGYADRALRGGLQQIADAGCGPACGATGCTAEVLLVDDPAGLSEAMADVVAAGVGELCNGVDDDCDGLTDEDFVTLGTPCLGPCPGTVCCDADDPTLTTCCAPPPRCGQCNRLDDDCDGIIDSGECCDGICCDLCYPEECNGFDDDCDCLGDSNRDGVECGPGDMNVDEEPLAGSGYPCGTDQGTCEKGLTCCVNSTPSCCGDVRPEPEICDCLDNDCNGATDELSTEPCYTLGDGCDAETGVCKGICLLGRLGCDDADPGPGCFPAAGECLGQRGPDPEACNCLDDDCDGLTDDDAPCPMGGRCWNCSCPQPCAPGTPCPAGHLCQCDKDDPSSCFCEVPCQDVQCSDCQYCDPDDSECHDVCEVVRCPAWAKCDCGRCQETSCSNPAIGCPDGKVCRDHGCVPREVDRLAAGGSGGCACGLRRPPATGRSAKERPCRGSSGLPTRGSRPGDRAGTGRVGFDCRVLAIGTVGADDRIGGRARDRGSARG